MQCLNDHHQSACILLAANTFLIFIILAFHKACLHTIPLMLLCTRQVLALGDNDAARWQWLCMYVFRHAFLLYSTCCI